MFEIILDAAAALILIGVVLFILWVVLRSLRFAFPFIFNWIFERKESVAREEAERIINDGNFEGWLVDRLREPFHKKVLNIRVKKKIVDSVQTVIIAFALMATVAIGGQMLMRLIER